MHPSALKEKDSFSMSVALTDQVEYYATVFLAFCEKVQNGPYHLQLRKLRPRR